MKASLRICLLCVILVPKILLANQQRFENLHNPTEYIFAASKAKVLETLRDAKRQLTPPPAPLEGSFRAGASSEAVYHFGFMGVYTRRYWTGRREKKEEVVPPEMGRIGTITGDFDVYVISKDKEHTLVKVTVVRFRQQVGRLFFLDKPMRDDVKSDTYYEYLFLLRLGELLGEKNMPQIKGSSQGDTYMEGEEDCSFGK